MLNFRRYLFFWIYLRLFDINFGNCIIFQLDFFLPPQWLHTLFASHLAAFFVCKYCLKRVAMKATVFLQNGLELKFRGGCDALGPEVLSFLTILSKKLINLENRTLIIKMTWNLGQILPMPVIRLFNQTPGSGKHDFVYKTPDIPPQRPICYYILSVRTASGSMSNRSTPRSTMKSTKGSYRPLRDPIGH